MKYKVRLQKTDDGYSVSCPGLPGCWSQGATEDEAIGNIRDAIQEYLAAVNHSLLGDDVRELDIPRLAMAKIPGVNHVHAARALEKVEFRVVRQGKHIVTSDGTRFLTIPRVTPVNSFTMGGIVKDSGLTVQQFKHLL